MKVSGTGEARHIMAGHADECAGEVRALAFACFVRDKIEASRGGPAGFQDSPSSDQKKRISSKRTTTLK